MSSADIKQILLPSRALKKIITTTSRWSVCNDDLTPESQMRILHASRNFYMEHGAGGARPPAYYALVMENIRKKLYSYKTQDLLKKKHDPDHFADFARVFELLVLCNMECHYCKKPVLLLYEFVREPMQWTLERIDNALGHNIDNLWIACLTCNLRRRCIRPERYELTKKCVNVVCMGAANDVADEGECGDFSL
jgi:hypothetical protein